MKILRMLPGVAPEIVEPEAAEAAAFEQSREPTVEKIKQAVIAKMAALQDGGIVFNGIPVATDERASADLAGAKQKARSSRKIVPRAGGGVRSQLSGSQFDALFDAVENYRQSVMDHAYDLLEQIDAAGDPSSVDIETGWPSNIINV